MILVLAAAALSAAPAAPPEKVSDMPACQQNQLRPARGGHVIGPHKLNEEPPARQLYTVLRIEDGCTKPVYVNERVIGAARR